MLCPMCGSETKISSTVKEDDCSYRYCRCLECDYSFRTVEIDDDLYESIAGSWRRDKPEYVHKRRYTKV